MLVDAAAAPAPLVLSRYCWRHVISDEPYAAVLLPGDGRPALTVNERCVDTPADLAAIARWADGCLRRDEVIAFLSLVALVALRAV